MQRLGRPQEAINYYERYKKAEPNIDAESAARINKFIDQAKALLEQTPEQVNLPPPPPKPDPALTPDTPYPGSVALNPTPTPGPDTSTASKPVYKKGWFWAVIGVGAAVVIGGVVTGVVLGQKKAPAELFLPNDTIYSPTF